VATGISKEKRDLVRFIKDAIRDIGGEGRRAAIEQVIEAVTAKGFARDKVREGIDMLLRHGEAMEPKQGNYPVDSQGERRWDRHRKAQK